MENKFNKGDIVYSVNITEYLVVNINRLIVVSFFFNKLPQYNKFIYSCDGLLQAIIRDYELPPSQDESPNDIKRNPGATISTSTGEEFLYTKEQLDDVIPLLVEERKQMNQRIANAADKFRCPLTGGKMKHDDSYMGLVMDGPRYYKVEDSKIIWEQWPRSVKDIYETEVDGVKYEFEYLGSGNWEKLEQS